MKKHAIIDVSSARVLVAQVVRGQVVACRSAPLEPGEWSERWLSWLARAEAPTRSLIGQMGLHGSEATIVYASPTSVTGVFSCPVAAGAEAAENAALLALSEQAGMGIRNQPSVATVLGADHAAHGAGGAQRHTLATSDHASTTAALAEWARGTGVEPATLVPDDVCGLVAAFRAVNDSGETRPRGVVWFGERHCVLAAAVSGRLKFIRVLRLGTEALTEALQRPLRPAGGGEPIQLGRGEAQALLAEAGIPLPGTAVPGRGLTGASVLPVVQPVLQRLGVELKQSLRFGLSEEERSAIALVLVGPGATIPRLDEVLAGQCGVPCIRDTATVDSGVPSAQMHAGWSALAGLDANLLPDGLQASRTLARMRKAVWVGGAAALALLATQGMFTYWHLESVRIEEQQARMELEAQTAAAATADAALAAIESRRALDARIASTMGPTADWPALLLLLSESTPGRVRITSVQAASTPGAMPTVLLSGHVLQAAPAGGVSASETAEDQGEPAAVLRRFVERLGSAPIVRQAKLGASQRTRVRDAEVQRFELTLTLVPVPAAPARGRSTAAVPTAEPTGVER